MGEFSGAYIYIYYIYTQKMASPFFWLTVANFQTKPGCFWEVSLAGNTGKLFGWGPSGRGRSTETTSANSMDNGQNNVLTNGGQSSTVKHPSWPSDLSHLIPKVCYFRLLKSSFLCLKYHGTSGGSGLRMGPVWQCRSCRSRYHGSVKGCWPIAFQTLRWDLYIVHHFM